MEQAALDEKERCMRHILACYRKVKIASLGVSENICRFLIKEALDWCSNHPSTLTTTTTTIKTQHNLLGSVPQFTSKIKP